MKITLTHKEQTEVIPDAVTFTIKIECRGIDHATSASRANELQNLILERLAPLGIDHQRLRLEKTRNEFSDYDRQPLKASTRRDLKIRIKHPELDTVRLIMDHLSIESDEVTASLEWKVIDSSSIRKQLLRDAMAALLKLAETAAPNGKATPQDISVNGANPHIHRHRAEDSLLSVEMCTGLSESDLEHHSTALSPSPVLYSTELTGTFILE
jgi:hypothetical protein